jgi:hypothetical protein
VRCCASGSRSGQGRSPTIGRLLLRWARSKDRGPPPWPRSARWVGYKGNCCFFYFSMQSGSGSPMLFALRSTLLGHLHPHPTMPASYNPFTATSTRNERVSLSITGRVPPFDLDDPRTIYSPLPRVTHKFICHSLPTSREKRDTIPKRRGSS